MAGTSTKEVVDHLARERAEQALKGILHVDQLGAEKQARVLDQIANTKEQITKLETSFQASTTKTEIQIAKIDADLNTFSHETRAALLEVSKEVRGSIKGVYQHLWIAASAVIGLLVTIVGFLLVQALFPTHLP